MTGGNQLHEESGNDKITFRLPTHLKEQFKEQVDNMSADLEKYVRQQVNQPSEDGGLEPYADPDNRDLAVAYRTLCKKRTKSGIVRGETAKRALAQAVDNIDQTDAHRLLRRLEKRGYVHLQNGIPPSDYMAVHVRPYSRHDPAKGGVRADA
ncbi:hypothetical protein [Haloarcula marina]|uniref:hypothetical protein n=1 Tax=Haloarcula marina TaxID=2961574 RepID=UPI0020B70C31|nr:hypothetical protein [Halomicroarcula marina]